MESVKNRDRKKTVKALLAMHRSPLRAPTYPDPWWSASQHIHFWPEQLLPGPIDTDKRAVADEYDDVSTTARKLGDEADELGFPLLFSRSTAVRPAAGQVSRDDLDPIRELSDQLDRSWLEEEEDTSCTDGSASVQG
jgi:hypothetical protein